MSISVSSRKSKARKLQQWVRDKIKEALNLPAEDVSSRSMGAQGTDILLSDRASRVFPFAVECKSQQNLSIWSAWGQAATNVSKSLPFPLLVVKRNNMTPLVILDADLFFKMIERLRDG